MNTYSYSKVDLFRRCPFHYKLRYLDHLTELPRYDPTNPLYLEHALYKGIELDEQAMIDDYLNSCPVITDEIVNELMKLQILLPKVKAVLAQFDDLKMQHEYKIEFGQFIGFADLIITAPDGTSSVIDFKYSNNVNNYLHSGQLHLYHHYLNMLGFNVTNLAYLFIPKSGIRQKKDEDLYTFRKRLEKTVNDLSVELMPIEYDEDKVMDFQDDVERIKNATEFPRNIHGDCFACKPFFAPNYLEALNDIKGEIQMITIPKNERREKKVDLKPDTWIYADSYVGKTTFWDKFDNVLMLNTDGNTDNITSPVMPIKDEVTKEGRITNRKFAWENFLDVIESL